MTDQPARERERPERKPMSPLQRAGMGFVVIALDTHGGSAAAAYDWLPDFLGWAMVLWGLAALRLPERRQLMGLAILCAVVSLVMWLPQVNEPVRGAELALKWALSLPDLAFIFCFSRSISAAARGAADRKFAGRFGVISWVTCLVAALPPIADAAGSEGMLGYADAAFVLLWLWLIWNTFAAHAASYAAARNQD